MENIGTQVRLPISTAVAIALQGIKIRLGRALVTISGVVLGIAFLMSVFTGELISGTGYIKGAMAQREELNNTVKTMESFVSQALGSPKDKIIGIIVAGDLEPSEQILAKRLARLTQDSKQAPKEVRAVGLSLPGLTRAEISDIGKDASMLIVMGNSEAFTKSFDDLTAGMEQVYVLDTYKPVVMASEESADNVKMRTYAGAPVVVLENSSQKYEQLYGAQQQEFLKEQAKKAESARFRTVWVMIISLLVTIIGITNSLLMSVTERFKEIGTMKCLGALSVFIRQLFLIESALIGFTGSFLGMLVGALLPMLMYSISYRDPATGALGAGFGVIFGTINYSLLLAAGFSAVVVGTLLAIMAAIYPANFAARMVPAMALRSNV
ncbi:MAG: ABC transporter permease YtrF precursor [bacterium ADurb.Bin429]|nr:MAG: ABC transporter permease YtrF precursor [bacterium ADurb.Bin429]